MKNQYFGDIQDYRKYGLLRQLTGAGRLSLGVVWMLTPGDERTDGSRLAYLEQPQLYRPLDPQLFGVLRESLGQQGRRGVAQIERSAALPDAVFFSDLTPDASEARGQFMAAARRAVAGAELVFLDPDNGFEVASVARGRKNSSKYVYWDEVQRMYAQGHSVLTYQHFPRVARAAYTRQRLEQLGSALPGAEVLAFATAHVGFFLALQEPHRQQVRACLPALLAAWGDVFSCVRLEGAEPPGPASPAP